MAHRASDVDWMIRDEFGGRVGYWGPLGENENEYWSTTGLWEPGMPGSPQTTKIVWASMEQGQTWWKEWKQEQERELRRHDR